MTDLERVKRMQSYNWVPASQYWRELYERAYAKLLAAEQKIKELQSPSEK